MCPQMVHLQGMLSVQAGWLADNGIQNATDDDLQQSLSAMQTNFDAFLHATQTAG